MLSTFLFVSLWKDRRVTIRPVIKDTIKTGSRKIKPLPIERNIQKFIDSIIA